MFSRKVCVIGCWPFYFWLEKREDFSLEMKKKIADARKKNNELQVREDCNGIFKQFDTLIMLK